MLIRERRSRELECGSAVRDHSKVGGWCPWRPLKALGRPESTQLLNLPFGTIYSESLLCRSLAGSCHPVGFDVQLALGCPPVTLGRWRSCSVGHEHGSSKHRLCVPVEWAFEAPEGAYWRIVAGVRCQHRNSGRIMLVRAADYSLSCTLRSGALRAAWPDGSAHGVEAGAEMVLAPRGGGGTT